MNIFVLDKDPAKAAAYHLDKHVVKMPLETAQMLCTTHYLSNSTFVPPYKKTHIKHPCNLWLLESLENYDWLCNLGLELCKEYTLRYGKIHACQKVIELCVENKPPIQKNGLTEFALAMPNEYKQTDPVQSYRDYYIKDKSHLFSWKNQNVPEWIKCY
jgi:hypothetical protein